MKLQMDKLIKIIRQEISKNLNIENKINLLNKDLLILDGSAKFTKYNSIILTNNLNQDARVVYKNKFDITSNSWKLCAKFKISDNIGIKDVDYTGGDGIWFEFNQKQLSIGIDTFMNEYNQTGNEINIFIEGQIVKSKFYPICFNNGIEHTIEIICNPIGSPTLAISINSKPFLYYNFKTIDMKYLFKEEAEFSIFSFTGNSGSKQQITKLDWSLI